VGVFTLSKGGHYARPFATWPWLGEQSMTRAVTFSPESEYDSAAYNSEDVNKLFGLSFGFGGIHKDSARDGWRWSKGDQCQELLAYCYTNGQRNWDSQLRFPVIAQVDKGQLVVSHIGYDKLGYYVFDVVDANNRQVGRSVSVVAPRGLPSYGLTHGLYFGGELVTPHDMTVRLDRV